MQVRFELSILILVSDDYFSFSFCLKIRKDVIFVDAIVSCEKGSSFLLDRFKVVFPVFV